MRDIPFSFTRQNHASQWSAFVYQQSIRLASAGHALQPQTAELDRSHKGSWQCPASVETHQWWLRQETSGISVGCACMLSHFSCVWRYATIRMAAHQAPLSLGFSRQEYRSELLCPPPGDPPYLGIETASLKSPKLADRFFTTRTTCGAHQ